MHRIKLTLGVGIVACLFAACASTAFASVVNFVTEAPHTIKGKEPSFSFGEGVVKCTAYSYTWAVEGESSTLPTKPEYTECHIGSLIKSPVKVVNSGCLLTFGELTEAESNKFTDTVAVTPKTCTLTFESTTKEGEKSSSCTITVSGEQAGLKRAEFEDAKTAEAEYDGKDKIEVSGLSYIAEKAGCTAVGVVVGSHANGAITQPAQDMPFMIAAPPARWKVTGLGGAFLGTGVSRAVKFNQQTSLEINATGGGNSKIICTTIVGAGEVEGTAAGTAGRGKITGLTFTGCSIQAGLAGCTLEEVTSPASATNPFSITLGFNRNGRLDYTIANAPETKITVKLSGASCGHQGSNLLKGVLEGTYSNAAEAVTFPSTALRFTNLTFLEESCIVIGKFRIELNAGGELVAD